MKITFSVIAALLGVVLFPQFTMAAIHHVNMVNYAFVPDSLAVEFGDTVVWLDVSGTHTTTSGVNGVPDGIWDSGFLSPGDSFAFAFDTLGTFPYYCTPHWSLGMIGKIVVNQTGLDEVITGRNQDITLGQNQPNPFASYTTINYQITEPAMTQIRIYNASGELVATLADRFGQPGNYAVLWDGVSNQGKIVPAGVYIYQLQTGGTAISRKMLVVR